MYSLNLHSPARWGKNKGRSHAGQVRRKTVNDETAQLLNDINVRIIVDILWASWPGLVTLRPFDIGMDGSAEDCGSFLKAIQDLGDAGFVSYEALIVGPLGPRIMDMTLTAKGRACCAAWLQPARLGCRQLAS
jgi:hypothetical protein